MTILTKADILQGIDTPKKIKITSLNGELWLRPLSSAEVNEILNIEAQGYGTFDASNNRGQTMANAKMNLAKMQEKTRPRLKNAGGMHFLTYQSGKSPGNSTCLSR